MKLDGALVAVTGASAGIGAALVEALVAAGARVAVGARRTARLQALARRFPRGQVVPLKLDVTDRSSCERFIRSAVRRLGGLDLLVNNAGLGQWMPVAETSPEDFATLLATNVSGPFWLTRAAVPHLPRGGVIVLVGSALAHRALPNMATYCGTKAFLLRFGEGLRLELRAAGIHVVQLSPGIVATEFAQAALRPGGASEAGRPSGAPAAEVAAALVAALRKRTPPREILPQLQGRVFATLNPLVPEVFDEALAPLAGPGKNRRVMPGGTRPR